MPFNAIMSSYKPTTRLSVLLAGITSMLVMVIDAAVSFVSLIWGITIECKKLVSDYGTTLIDVRSLNVIGWCARGQMRSIFTCGYKHFG